MKCTVILMILFVSVRAQVPPDCQGPWCPITCPPGTYRYAVGCDYLLPEATCTNPNPEKGTEAMICDYQACYCSPPTVRNEDTKECVELEDCPTVICTPKTPAKPRTPARPRPPATPRTPARPRVPDTPESPAKPRTPATP